MPRHAPSPARRTADDIVADLAAGATTVERELDAALRRIDERDGSVRAYRAVLVGSAREDARRAQARVDAGETAPLLGVPVAIKDDADVAGDVTPVGTAAHDGRPAAADAEVVARLRAAGAVVLGRTHVPELCAWPFTESVTHGATRNPWDVARTPGGSSGGSAAAVASGTVPLALGSDSAGSIRGPAAFCHLLGVKPTKGLVPLAPRGPETGWHGLAHYGPLAATTADAARFLDAVAVPDPEGAYREAAGEEPRRLRIAVSDAAPPGIPVLLGAEQRAALQRTADLLRELGHEVVERPLDLPAQLTRQITARYLRGIHDDAARMAHPARLEPRTRALARAGALVPLRSVHASRRREPRLVARVGAIFRDHDLVLTPGPSGPPFAVGTFARRSAAVTFAASAARYAWYGALNLTGHPALSLPAGFDHLGLPIGVQVVGPLRAERSLLRLAGQVEAARPWAQAVPGVG